MRGFLTRIVPGFSRMVAILFLAAFVVLSLSGASDPVAFELDQTTNRCVAKDGQTEATCADCRCKATNEDGSCSECPKLPSPPEANNSSEVSSPDSLSNGSSESGASWSSSSSPAKDANKNVESANSGDALYPTRSVRDDGDSNIAPGIPDRPTREDGYFVLYSLWNGFIDITNILEIVNTGDTTEAVTVVFRTIDGSVGNYVQFALEGGMQRDVILNDLKNFAADSYGIIEVISKSASIDGRISYYRKNAAGISYDFVFNVALTLESIGKTAVGFNTYQPSHYLAHTERLVANWLTLVNLDPDKEETFRVTKYNQEGKKLGDTLTLTLPPRGRQDIEAGHVNPGPNHVGVVIIDPVSEGAKYIAQLMRYGYQAKPGEPNDGFDFGFLLVAYPAVSGPAYIPLSQSIGDGEFLLDAWLEVVNSADVTSTITLTVHPEGSTTPVVKEAELAAHSQQHFFVKDLLGGAEKGLAVLTSSEPDSIVAQAMYYIRDSNGAMESIYGSQLSLSGVPGDTIYASWNRFLGMLNYLNVINPTDEPIDAEIDVRKLDGTNTTHTRTIAANSVEVFPLHEDGWGTSSDSYGVVAVKGGLLAELLRVGTTLQQASLSKPFSVIISAHAANRRARASNVSFTAPQSGRGNPAGDTRNPNIVKLDAAKEKPAPAVEGKLSAEQELKHKESLERAKNNQFCKGTAHQISEDLAALRDLIDTDDIRYQDVIFLCWDSDKFSVRRATSIMVIAKVDRTSDFESSFPTFLRQSYKAVLEANNNAELKVRLKEVVVRLRDRELLSQKRCENLRRPELDEDVRESLEDDFSEGVFVHYHSDLLVEETKLYHDDALVQSLASYLDSKAEEFINSIKSQFDSTTHISVPDVLSSGAMSMELCIATDEQGNRGISLHPEFVVYKLKSPENYDETKDFCECLGGKLIELDPGATLPADKKVIDYPELKKVIVVGELRIEVSVELVTEKRKVIDYDLPVFKTKLICVKDSADMSDDDATNDCPIQDKSSTSTQPSGTTSSTQGTTDTSATTPSTTTSSTQATTVTGEPTVTTSRVSIISIESTDTTNTTEISTSRSVT